MDYVIFFGPAYCSNTRAYPGVIKRVDGGRECAFLLLFSSWCIALLLGYWEVRLVVGDRICVFLACVYDTSLSG